MKTVLLGMIVAYLWASLCARRGWGWAPIIVGALVVAVLMATIEAVGNS